MYWGVPAQAGPPLRLSPCFSIPTEVCGHCITCINCVVQWVAPARAGPSAFQVVPLFLVPRSGIWRSLTCSCMLYIIAKPVFPPVYTNTCSHPHTHPHTHSYTHIHTRTYTTKPVLNTPPATKPAPSCPAPVHAAVQVPRAVPAYIHTHLPCPVMSCACARSCLSTKSSPSIHTHTPTLPRYVLHMCTQLSKYQEQSQLLDVWLESMVGPLACLLRKQVSICVCKCLCVRGWCVCMCVCVCV